MRIKVVQTPSEPVIDGIPLDGFHPGVCYEVGTTVGTLFLAEGWAVPGSEDEPALPMTMAELESELESRTPECHTDNVRAFSSR
jgi:hypothetical protein